MKRQKSLHSICRWTFNAGKGGFVPGDMRPEWADSDFDTVAMIQLIKRTIMPRLPEYIELGIEVHYDHEFNEQNAAAIAAALNENGLYLAMTTPGAHTHFAYGGIASLDPNERQAAAAFGQRALELTYGPLRKAWHPEPEYAPTFVLWNGSFGYDLATIGIKSMYQNLKTSVANLCQFEAKLGDQLYLGFEPKPNEGHPAMLIPTVASALIFWRRLEDEFGISRVRKGVNKEFGHSEMIGLDHIYDTVEELDNQAIVHMHLNSQGYNDGIVLGGPGKYDIDHGTRVNGMNIAVAGLVQQGNYRRWKGHDMQTRAYDNTRQGIDRVVRSILSWEACARAAAELNTTQLMNYLTARETAKAEDLMRDALVNAQHHFNEMYQR
ncbi:xylose isomerase [candidate division KSB1 bacterium]|nr:xylose isomerase [candidate division KSB1 bacterium]